MLEVIRKNKMYVVMMLLFGVVGVLIIPVILGIEKFSKSFPKVYRCVIFTVFFIIMAACIYCIFIKHQMNFSVICICVAAVFCDIVKKENK